MKQEKFVIGTHARYQMMKQDRFGMVYLQSIIRMGISHQTTIKKSR